MKYLFPSFKNIVRLRFHILKLKQTSGLTWGQVDNESTDREQQLSYSYRATPVKFPLDIFYLVQFFFHSGSTNKVLTELMKL